MNNVVLSGRLTKNPELKYIQGNEEVMAMTKFVIAVDRNLSKEKKTTLEENNKSTTDFVNISAFGKIAKNVAKFCDKGSKILVQGRIQTGSYEKEGIRIYTTEIISTNIEFMTPKSKEESDEKHFEGFEFGTDFNPLEENGKIEF